MTVDATPGGAASNSYATRAQANDYHDAHLYGAAWAAATDAQKDVALVMATRLLDIHIAWNGAVASTEQALLLPRTGLFGPNGLLVSSAAIPTRVVEATAELARQLLASDRTADSEHAGIERLKAGPVELTFSGSYTPNVLPDAVFDMVRAFGSKKAGRLATMELVRM